MTELTQDLLKELFDYRDGELYWKVRKAKNTKIGDRAGNIMNTGYWQIGINGKNYLTHRLIFLWHHGYLPKGIDHIDGEKSNNDISNLREATQQENLRNRKKQKYFNGKSTSSDHKGVSWDKTKQKWRSYIYIDGKEKFLGYYDSETEAAEAYKKAASELFGPFARLNEV